MLFEIQHLLIGMAFGKSFKVELLYLEKKWEIKIFNIHKRLERIYIL